MAQSPGMLVASRALRGLGGALVSPAALSIITTTFTDNTERTRALGVWSAIAAGLMPMSIGMGLVFVPITLLGTGGVRDEDAGLASGLFDTAQQVGGSLGLAILSTLAATSATDLLHAGSGALIARVGGYQVAFGAAAAMLGAGAVILATSLRRRDVDALELGLTTPATVAEPAAPADEAARGPASTPAPDTSGHDPSPPEWATLESSGSSA